MASVRNIRLKMPYLMIEVKIIKNKLHKSVLIKNKLLSLF